MPQIVFVAEVEDSVTWEERFRTHKDLFTQLYGPMGMNVINFTTTSDNTIVLYTETTDLDAYFATLDTDDIKAAMAEDGVKRDTVQVYVLDKELQF